MRSLLRQIKPILGSAAIALFFVVLGCTGTTAFDGTTYQAQVQSYSGYVVVATNALPTATGPGMVTLFDQNGNFVRVVKDYYADTLTPTGLAALNEYQVLVLVSGASRVDRLDLRTGESTVYMSNAGITTPFGNMAKSSLDDSIFIPERSLNTIEKVDANGTRVSNPLVTTTSGTCTLSTPWGITYIPGLDRIAVINNVAAGRLNVYSADGTCVTSVNAAPFSSNTPAAIAYHSLADKLITVFAGNHAVVATNTSGTSASTIYLNSTVVSVPRAITIDTSGYIYIGSDGVDTIEKFSFPGTGSASRVGTTPFIPAGVYSQNPAALLVMP